MLRSVLELLEVQPSWATAMRQDRDRPYVLDYPLSFAGICDIAAGFVLCAGMVPFRRVREKVSALSRPCPPAALRRRVSGALRSEEHTSELQSLMRISYAVFCLKKKTQV